MGKSYWGARLALQQLYPIQILLRTTFDIKTAATCTFLYSNVWVRMITQGKRVN